MAKEYLLKDEETVRQVILALERSGMLAQSGELYQKIGQLDRSLECYRRGHHYAKAIELARASFPAGKFLWITFPIS